MQVRLTNAPATPGVVSEFLDIEYYDGRSYFGTWMPDGESVVCTLPPSYIEYGISPEQYHAGIDKLWDALKLKGVQDQDVFTLAAERIKELEAFVKLCDIEVVRSISYCPKCGRRLNSYNFCDTCTDIVGAMINANNSR